MPCESSWPHAAEELLNISYQGGALSSLMEMGVVCSNLIVSVVHFLHGVKGKAKKKSQVGVESYFMRQHPGQCSVI